MTKKTPEARASDRERARAAAEEDARQMLLAAGVLPGQGRDSEAVQALLREPPPPAHLAYTVQQFCAMLDMSRSTFYRMRRENNGPAMVRLFGMPRILAEEARRWVLANSRTIEPEGLARARAEFAARQRELPGMPKAKARKPRRTVRAPEGMPGHKESIFDPPPSRKGNRPCAD